MTSRVQQRILVTGGSGFIGTRVVAALLGRACSVANLDIKRPLDPAQESCWYPGDLLDAERVRRCLEEVRPDAVIHLGAKAEIAADAWEDFASIHRGTAHLLAAIDGQDSVRRVANISTQLVIGPGIRPRSNLDFHPYTVYGQAKAFAEGLLLQWPSAIHWFTVRPAVIWGPDHPSFADGIWKYIRKRLYMQPSRRPPVMRSYGYVENTADQIVDLLEQDRERTHRQIFYAADAVIDSALWVDAFSLALTGRRARRIPVPLLKTLGVAGDMVAWTGIASPINSGRALRMSEDYPVPVVPTLALTGSPRVDLGEGVRRTVAWLNAGQENQGASGDARLRES